METLGYTLPNARPLRVAEQIGPMFKDGLFRVAAIITDRAYVAHSVMMAATLYRPSLNIGPKRSATPSGRASGPSWPTMLEQTSYGDLGLYPPKRSATESCRANQAYVQRWPFWRAYVAQPSQTRGHPRSRTLGH